MIAPAMRRYGPAPSHAYIMATVRPENATSRAIPKVRPRALCCGQPLPRKSSLRNMSDVFDIYTIIFLALAVFIFLRLRSVLGQRTGRERPPSNPYARQPVPPSERL